MEKLLSSNMPATENIDIKFSEQATPLGVYEGFVESPLFSEEARIILYQEEICMISRFDQLSIPYGEIAAFQLKDYRLKIHMVGGEILISRMGQTAQWLYEKLYSAYNDVVLKALFVRGNYDFETVGEYAAQEAVGMRQGRAVIRLYEDCLCILPPDENARRIPLCFLVGMEKEEHAITLILSTGERYSLWKLGQDLDQLEWRLTEFLQALRERTHFWFKELASGLRPMEVALAAKLMPLGTAAFLDQLAIKVPPLVMEIEKRIQASRMAKTYPWLKSLGDGKVMVGIKPLPQKAEESERMALDMNSEGEDAAAEKPDSDAVLWTVASCSEGRIAAVELALPNDQAAATYLYRVEGRWEVFARLIDRALDATGFQRRMILLSDDALNEPEHLAEAMLVRRTPALLLLRRCFVGRAIHSSYERWLREIKVHDPGKEDKAKESMERVQTFCESCGKKFPLNGNFCMNCGVQR